MHLWPNPSSIYGIHHWWAWCTCGPIQDTSHSWLANPNHLNRAPQLFGSCQFLPQVRVGVLSYHLALNQVTKGGVKEKFFWSKTQQWVLPELKNRLYSALVLTLPNLQQPLEIETYASDYAIGVVITQHGNIVAYHRETLSDIVQKYPTYNKEMYSILYAFHQWKNYILAMEMVIHTDNWPL